MKNEIKVILTADIKNLQAALSKAQQSLQQFEAKNAAETEKSNESKKRQLGIIEKLNIKAKELQVSLTRATSKEEIIKFNQQLEQTKKKLSDLNVLGKSSTNPVGIINNLNVELRKLKSSIASATDEKQIAKLNVQLKQTEQELKRIISLGQVKSGPTGLINSLNAEAKQLKASIALATDETEVARLNQELQRTQQELQRINALGKNIAAPAVRSFDNLKRASGAATASAISFGRIIQDAPFGIIGVANNIQNFGEQFAALGGKATSAGGKLKLFFSALIQPTSLAVLAVSALTAAYQAYALGLFDAEEETKDLRTETQKLNDSLDNLENSLNAVDSARLNSKKGAVDEMVELELLNSVLKDTSKSESERIRIYNILLEKYPRIVKNVEDEKKLIDGLGDSYEILVRAIGQKAAATAIEEKLVQIGKERLNLIQKEQNEVLLDLQLRKQKANLQKEEAIALQKLTKLQEEGAEQSKIFTATANWIEYGQAIDKVDEELKNLGNTQMVPTTNALLKNSANVEFLKNEYLNLSQTLISLLDPLQKVEAEAKNIFETLSRTETDEVIRLFDVLLNFKDEVFNFEQMAAPFTSISSGAAETSKVFGKSLKEIKAELISFEEALESVGLTSAQVFQAISLGSAEGFNSLSDFITKLAGTQEFFNEAFQILEVGIEQTLGDVAFAIGNALGEGTNALQAGGAALLGGISRILNELGQYAIGVGVTLEKIKIALKTLNGPIAIAAGVALIALAGFISSKANSLSGRFAGGGGGSPSAGQGSTFTNRREFGGPVSKGRAYIVGEKRPELFVPNTNGIIVPQLPSMDYSGASVNPSVFGVDVRLKGPDDLLFFVEQAQIRRGIR
jgi:hypothetical protein